MTLTLDVVLRAAAIGVLANGLMDLWNLALRRFAGVKSLDFALLGRWILHMPSGTFVHRPIGKAAPRKGERVVGWAAHYAIGVTFAVGFVVIVSAAWLARPTVLPALAYGVATVVFPYFLMQPALARPMHEGTRLGPRLRPGRIAGPLAGTNACATARRLLGVL